MIDGPVTLSAGGHRRRVADVTLLGGALSVAALLLLDDVGLAVPRGPVSHVVGSVAVVMFLVTLVRSRRSQSIDRTLTVGWALGLVVYLAMTFETPFVLEDDAWTGRYLADMLTACVVIAAAGYFALPIRLARPMAAVAVLVAASGIGLVQVVRGGAVASAAAFVFAAVAVLLVDLHGEAVAAMARSEAEAKAKAFFADVDVLTGLRNRRGMQAVVADRWPVSLLLLDLDRFKSVNDEHGHDVGDEVLVAVADALQRALRDDDVVGRWGGEEFLVLASTSAAGSVSERLRRAVEEADTPVPMTTSIGVAVPEGASDSFERALKRADEALYRAKELGRNRVVGVPGEVSGHA